MLCLHTRTFFVKFACSALLFRARVPCTRSKEKYGEKETFGLCVGFRVIARHHFFTYEVHTQVCDEVAGYECEDVGGGNVIYRH